MQGNNCQQEEAFDPQHLESSSLSLVHHNANNNVFANYDQSFREQDVALQSHFKMNDDCNSLLSSLHSEESINDEMKNGRFDSYESFPGDNFNYNTDGGVSACVSGHETSTQSVSLVTDPLHTSSSLEYTCHFCNQHFVLSNDLSKHISDEHSQFSENISGVSQGDGICDDGKKDLSSSQNLRGNAEGNDSIANLINSLRCPVCHLEFSSETDKSHHMREDHAILDIKEVTNDLFTCSFCPKAYKMKEQLQKHEARHPYGTSAIECFKCGEVLGNYILLKEHKQYEDYLSSCDLCGKLFPNEECMVCHIRNSHNDFEDFYEKDEDASISSQENNTRLSNIFLDESHTMDKESLHHETNYVTGQSKTQNEILPVNQVSSVNEGFCDKEVLLPIIQEKRSFQDAESIEEQKSNNAHEILNLGESSTHEEEEETFTNSRDLQDIEPSTNVTNVTSSFERDMNDNDDLGVQKIVSENLSVNTDRDPEESSRNEENISSNECDEGSSKKRSSSGQSKLQKIKCQFCTKKCSSQKSLLRHEKTHPYATAAIKCNLCQELVENYKALKIHKKHQGTKKLCSTCDQMFPNDVCLSCHLRNVHNSVDETELAQSADDNSNETDNDVNDNEYDFDDEESAEDEKPAAHYSVLSYTVSDAGAPLRITIKQAKENVPSHMASPTSSMSNPLTPSTPSPQGPPTPSPPAFVFESESSNEDDDDNYEPYASDNSALSQSGRTSRRKSALRTTQKMSTQNLLFLSSSEESDLDKSGDFNYNPQSNSESEDDSDEDPEWRGTENFIGVNKKRSTRRRGPHSDDSDDDPDWRNVQSSSGPVKKKARRRKGPLSDNDSENDLDWTKSFSGSYKKRKKTDLSEDDSDYDPDWRNDHNSSGTVKKKVPGKRGRRKKIVGFVIPSLMIPKSKRSKARGCGGQKAQDAAAALAEAVEDMESSVPELKVVIRPLKRSHGGSITKASVKRYSEMFDSEYDHLLDVKPEPKDGSEVSNHDCVAPLEENQTLNVKSTSIHKTEDIHSNEEIPPTHESSETDGNSWENHEQEQIIIKAEPYDFHDDELSESSDPYSIGKYSNSDPRCGSPSDKFDPNAPDSKREMRYACKICGRELQYRSHLLRHLRRVHGGEGVDEVMRRLMKCRFCSKQYSNELSLINHEKLHDGTNKIKCNKCDELFDDKNALRRHQRKTHWEHQPVECEICKKQLADNTCLRAHMKHMHAAEERKVTLFTCETCGKQLHTKTAFQNHVASKCGTNLLFPCETCGKSFSFKGSLKAHQLLHTGVKSFLCKFCGKAFHQKGEMKRHERKHTGEKPFVCEVCGRAFAYRESLLGHSAVHTGIKPFPCKACGMRFSCSGNLVKHRRSNNCKGSGEPGDNVPNSEQEKEIPQESLEVNLLTPNVSSVIVTSANVSKTFPIPTSTPETNKQDQNSIQTTTAKNVESRQSSVSNDCQMQASYETSVIKTTPVINVKPTAALQSIPKEVKPVMSTDILQSYGVNNVSNRHTSQLNQVFNSLDNSVTVHNNYSAQNLGYPENHYRQGNHVNLNDRRFAQFSIEGYSGRTDQYFDHQSFMRREMGRQVIDRSVDRQASRFLDCFGGVQFSGVDSRSSVQPYPSVSVSHPTTYPNIHSGHLSTYAAAAAAAHSTNHSNSHVNMYGSNTMIPGSVSFPAFTAGNHIGMGYTHNNPIPAHSAPHSGSFPTAHMSHFEALFGHLSHPSVHAANTFPRLTPHNIGPSANNSSLNGNHRA